MSRVATRSPAVVQEAVLTSAPHAAAETIANASLLQRVAKRLVCARLQPLRLPIEIRDHHGVAVSSDAQAPLRVVVHDPRFWTAIAFDGSDGSGDAYAAGWWTTDDITAVVRVWARHRDRLEQLDGGWARLAMPLFKMANLLRRNTRAGARANIHAHYDLGNSFFSQWLDPTMTYSSGWFASSSTSLEQAQIAKLDRLFERIELKAGDHLVEIGTGWGELALHAARRGARVTTITISAEQHRLAAERAVAAGFADRIEVKLCDYRDLTGSYDKLVSVEMIEAVGSEFYDAYFATIGRLLKPGGIAAIQAITIPEQQFARAARESDFIKRRIFPGCCIPSVESLLAAMRRSSDLSLVQLDDFAAHYARTLDLWHETFMAKSAELRRLGYDDRFQRLWSFYLAYCSGGFAERALGVAHLVFARPGWRAVDQHRLVPALFNDDLTAKPVL